MNALGQSILDSLAAVEGERLRRQQDPNLSAAVDAVKRFQHRRFERSYSDLLSEPRYSSAARFFLEDLYGPTDFSQRDRQFARIVPPLVRLFPEEIVQTVADLSALHALSERLDSAMGMSVGLATVDGRSYAVAWRQVGTAVERERQISLMVGVGRALDRYTKKAVLRHTLRIMRGPAQAAGLGTLQQFLERGFDTFKGMRGADEFLALIAARERDLAARLFAGGDSD